MRHIHFGFIGTMALASMMASNGCSSGGGEGGSGGKSASSAPNCPNGSTCGGDVVGTWDVTSSCVTFSGDMDTTAGSIECTKLPVTGTLEVTGTWIAKSNGSYQDKTTTKGTISFSLDSSCMKVSRAPVTCDRMGYAFTTLGWTEVTCSETNGKCSCTGTTKKTGGLGTASPFSLEDGDYETSGSDLKLDSQIQFSYCVDGKKLTLTPKPGVLPLKGTIVLQNSGTAGTGGGGSSGSSGGGSGGSESSSASQGGSSGTSPGGTAGGGSKGGSDATSAGGTTSSSGKAGSGGTGSNGGTTTSGGSKGGTTGSVTGGNTSSGGNSAGGTTTTSTGSGSRPCDIYSAGSVKCVAAHSTVRALYASYSGKLYRIKRASDNTYQDISVSEAGGIADSSIQETFCANTKCTITRVYDQSGNGNYVDAETQDAEEVSARPQQGNNGMSASNAMQEALTVGGKKVYSLYMKQAQAYWHDGSKTKIPLGKDPQAVYMVTSGKHFGDGCCFNYGSGPLSRKVTECGSIDAVNFSSNKIWDYGSGNGPWIMADFECGLVAGGKGKVPSMTSPYVTAIEKNKGSGDYVLRGADAQKGNLTTVLTAKLPYSMKKEGAVDLGSGGDCCYSNTTMSQGTFYEGAIIAGYPSDEVEDQVQANIVSAGYKELQ